MQPLVTTIIPSYNHGRYIRRTIQSVLDQTYENVELIVVDDGSSDCTAEVLNEFESDPRIKVILNEQNRGQGAVVNQGLAASSGEFICILPSDDWFLPDKLKLQVEKFLGSPPRVGVVYCRSQRFFEDTGEFVNIDPPMRRGNVVRSFLIEGNFIEPACPMFRRECFAEVQPNEKYYAEGEAIYPKIALSFDFEYVDEYLVVMRDHLGNAGKRIHDNYRDTMDSWNSFFEDMQLPAEIAELKNDTLARVHRTFGLSFVGDYKDYAWGRRALLASARAKPLLLLKDWKISAGLVLATVMPLLRFRQQAS